MRFRFVAALATVLLAALVATVPAPSATAPGLSKRLGRALAGPSLSLGRTGAVVVDLETGTVLFAHNDAKPVVPASNEKLPVAWAALVRLGPAYRFHTELYGVGVRSGSTWEGDLVLKGFGDPTLSAADLAGLSRRVAALGIARVTGRVRGDESYYDRERGVASWKRGFLGFESPPLSALVVDRANGWPALSPPLLAAKALTAALVAAGVQVDGRPGLGRAGASAVPLVSDRSVTLARILRFMGHESDNFTAEMLLKQLGAVAGTGGTTAAGASIVRSVLAETGIPLAGVRIADGSGLSPADRLTPAALVAILRAAWGTPELRDTFVTSLAVAGASGTMRDRLPALRGIVRAKTGTTNLACSLSGFVGDRFAFSIVENGTPVSYWTARQAQDRFVTLLAAEAAKGRALARPGS
jgi:D-alanyl-D-alanine carboxypeptidase/D-alanyl-D-alanine-endopeptidase (penicillin-binding protein 4)